MPGYHFMPASVRQGQATSNAHAALGLARRRGLPIPEPIALNEEVLAALHSTIGSTPTTDLPNLPDRAADVTKAIAKVAAERARHDQAVQLAQEWIPTANDRLLGSIQRAVTGWVQPVVDVFAEQLQQFREAAGKAPHVDATQLAGIDPASFAAWQKAQSAVYELEATLEDRRVLAEALAERFDSMHFGDLAIVAIVAPPKGEDGAALLAAARERRPLYELLSGRVPHAPATTRGAAPTTLTGMERWRTLLQYEDMGWLRVSLAGLDEAARRVEVLEAWQNLGPQMHADSANQTDRGTKQLLDRMQAVHSTLTTSASSAA